MFFRNTKNRWAKNSIQLIDHLKVTLFSILADEFKVDLLLKGNVDKTKCDEFAKQYAAYVVNRLFGDSNVEIYKGNEELFDTLDYYHKGTAGVILGLKYPELKPLLTDAVMRYYEAHGNLGTKKHLAPLQATFDGAVKMDLIISEKKDFRTFSDKEYIEAIKSLDEKHKENLPLLNKSFNYFIHDSSAGRVKSNTEECNKKNISKEQKESSIEKSKKTNKPLSINKVATEQLQQYEICDKSFDVEFIGFIGASQGLNSMGLVYCPELLWFESFLYTFGDDYKRNISTLERVLFDFMELDEVQNYVRCVHELDFHNVSEIERADHLRYTKYRVMLNVLKSNLVADNIRDSHKMRYFEFVNTIKLDAINIFQQTRIVNLRVNKENLEEFIIKNSKRINSLYDPYDFYLQFELYFVSLDVNPIELEKWLLDDVTEE